MLGQFDNKRARGITRDPSQHIPMPNNARSQTHPFWPLGRPPLAQIYHITKSTRQPKMVITQIINVPTSSRSHLNRALGEKRSPAGRCHLNQSRTSWHSFRASRNQSYAFGRLRSRNSSGDCITVHPPDSRGKKPYRFGSNLKMSRGTKSFSCSTKAQGEFTTRDNSFLCLTMLR